MKTICLNMIVKNEARIIQRMLASVLPVIDSFCIVDTGSTDDTVALIRAFAAEHALPGVVVSAPFVNFEVSRTRALVEARKNVQSDYLLLMDADMVLQNEGFDKAALNCDVYLLYQGSPSLQYLNARLVSTTLTCKYTGVTHEYLDIQGAHTSGNLTTLRINDLGDGGAKSDKFTRDIRLLTEGLAAEPNNARYHFYLGNSYYDSGNPAKAVDSYVRRVQLGGWSEEVFYSLYRLCLCYKQLKNVDLFLLYGLKAWLVVPTRAESVYELVKHYREEGNQKLAYSLYLLVKDLAPPPNGLFVHMDVYRYKLAYEFSILAYYCGAKTEVFRTFEGLFGEPEMDLSHLLGNYKFYAPRPTPLETLSFSCTHVIDGVEFCGSSPSIVAAKDATYLVNVRLVNYKLKAGNYEVPNNKLVTRNKRVSLDSNLQVTAAQLVETVDATRQPKDHACTWHGVEDVKLADVGGTLYFTGTKCLATERIGVCWGEYRNPLTPLELESKQECEKNWVFIPGRLEMIYSWAPLRFGPIRGRALELSGTRPMPRLFSAARGSSNGAEWRGEYWFVVHFVQKQGHQRLYYHAIAVFDRELNLLRYTLPFKFRAGDVEYCLGLVVEDDRVLVTHSENDADPQLCAYRHTEFPFV